MQNESRLHVAGDTGAKEAPVIRCLGGSVHKFPNIGDIVVCTVKQAVLGGIVKKGDVVEGVIVCIKHGVRHDNRTYIRFGDNAIALIKGDNTPRRACTFGPVACKLHDRGFVRIMSLVLGVS